MDLNGLLPGLSPKPEIDCNKRRNLTQHLKRTRYVYSPRLYNTFHFEKFQIAYFQLSNKKQVCMDWSSVAKSDPKHERYFMIHCQYSY